MMDEKISRKEAINVLAILYNVLPEKSRPAIVMGIQAINRLDQYESDHLCLTCKLNYTGECDAENLCTCGSYKEYVVED